MLPALNHSRKENISPPEVCSKVKPCSSCCKNKPDIGTHRRPVRRHTNCTVHSPIQKPRRLFFATRDRSASRERAPWDGRIVSSDQRPRTAFPRDDPFPQITALEVNMEFSSIGCHAQGHSTQASEKASSRIASHVMPEGHELDDVDKMRDRRELLTLRCLNEHSASIGSWN